MGLKKYFKKKKDVAEEYKRAFGVSKYGVTSSRFRDAAANGLIELAKWVKRCEDLEHDDIEQAEEDLDDCRNAVNQALNLYNQDSTAGAEKLKDDVLPDLGEKIKTWRQEAKNTPEKKTITTDKGDRDVEVFWTDIPGFEDMSGTDQQKAVDAVAKKVAKGLDLYEDIAGDRVDLNAETTVEQVTDLMWALKSKAQKKAQGGFIKGAMTVPNGEKLRAFLDKCPDRYGRKSSHIKKQQKGGPGHSPRGMDLYGGTEALAEDKEDVSGLLPAGMNAMLWQQVDGEEIGQDGEGKPIYKQLLYLKMETEGARVGGTVKGDETLPTSRDMKVKDVGRSIKHLGNLIKGKMGFKEEPDKDLKTTREEWPEAAKKAAKKIMKKVNDKPSKAALKNAYDTGRLSTYYDALLELDPDVYDSVEDEIDIFTDAYDEVMEKLGKDTENRRYGGEVVLLDGDVRN